MALVLLQSGMDPLGQFDAQNSLISTVKGGEVLTFGAVTTATQQGAADRADGYQSTAGTNVALVLAGATNTSAGNPPYMLCDDGLLNYGTLFGSVVGGTVGQQSNGPNTYTGAVLGPATAVGSGKLTAWDKPGLFGVTLDACDSTSLSGLQPSNGTPLVPGAKLYYVSAANATTAALQGQITPNVTLSPGGAGPVIGYFTEFRSKGSLVTTPNRLVSALNSPSSVVGGLLPSQIFMCVFHFAPNS